MLLAGDIHGLGNRIFGPHYVGPNTLVDITPFLHRRWRLDVVSGLHVRRKWRIEFRVDPVRDLLVRSLKCPEIPIGNPEGMYLVSPCDSDDMLPLDCRLAARSWPEFRVIELDVVDGSNADARQVATDNQAR